MYASCMHRTLPGRYLTPDGSVQAASPYYICITSACAAIARFRRQRRSVRKDTPM